jgi:hypothetical protein
VPITPSLWKNHCLPLALSCRLPVTPLPRHGSRPSTLNAEHQPSLEDAAPPSVDWSRSPCWSPCSHAGTAASLDTRSCSVPTSIFPEFGRLKVSTLPWLVAPAPLVANKPSHSPSLPTTWRCRSWRKTWGGAGEAGSGCKWNWLVGLI